MLMLLKFPKSPTFGPFGTSSAAAMASRGGKAGKQAKVVKLTPLGQPPAGRLARFRTVSSEAGAAAGATLAGGAWGVSKVPAARKQRSSKPSVRAAARDLLAAIARDGATPSPPPTNKKGGGAKTSRAGKRSPRSRNVGGAGGGGAAGSKENAGQSKKARRSPVTVSAAGGIGGAGAGTARSPEGGGAVYAHAAAKPGDASFFVKGMQGQLDVCEYRTIEDEGKVRPYLLVRLRGQSNTLPNDASLSVKLPEALALGAGAAADGSGQSGIDVSFSRVRLKAGGLKYDYLPAPVKVPAVDGGSGCEFEAPLLSSIFSKKCWQGMVVRGPRMFIAYIKDPSGTNRFRSVPMFVEISPTSNSPEYRDPVLEYSREVLRLFFDDSTVTHVYANSTSSGGRPKGK